MSVSCIGRYIDYIVGCVGKYVYYLVGCIGRYIEYVVGCVGRYIDHIRLTNQPEPHHMLVSDQAVYLEPASRRALLACLTLRLTLLYLCPER